MKGNMKNVFLFVCTFLFSFIDIIDIYHFISIRVGLHWWLSDNELVCQSRRHGFDPWIRKIPWRRKWQPTWLFLLEKSQWTEESGGLTPWGRKKSQTWLHDWTTTKYKARSMMSWYMYILLNDCNNKLTWSHPLPELSFSLLCVW